MIKGKVVAVCHSDQKGTRKVPVPSGVFVEDYGLSGDAHAESGIGRQVSLLAEESIEKMKRLGIEVGAGDFARTDHPGMALHLLAPAPVCAPGADVLLEITQIGKACHKGCAIFEQVGTCIMPKEGSLPGIRGGTVHTGDAVEIEKQG